MVYVSETALNYALDHALDHTLDQSGRDLIYPLYTS